MWGLDETVEIKHLAQHLACSLNSKNMNNCFMVNFQYRFLTSIPAATTTSWVLHLFPDAQSHHPLHGGLPVICIWYLYFHHRLDHITFQSAFIFPATFASLGLHPSHLLSVEVAPKLSSLPGRLRSSKPPKKDWKRRNSDGNSALIFKPHQNLQQPLNCQDILSVV